MRDVLDDDARPYEEPGEDESKPGFDPVRSVLRAIKRFPFTIGVLTVLGTVGGLLYGSAQPNTYRSVGMMLVRFGAREQRTPEGSIAEGVQTRGAGIGAGDELLLFQNPALHRRVLDRVGAADILRPLDPRAGDGPGTPAHIRWLHELQANVQGFGRGDVPTGPATEKMFAAAIARLASGLEVNMPRGTSTIHVAFTAHSPELARRIAEAYLKVFQERHFEVYETTAELAFLTEQLAAAEVDKERAREALSERRDEERIRDIASLEESLRERITVLETANDQDWIERTALAEELATVEEQLTRKAGSADGGHGGGALAAPVAGSRALTDLRHRSLVAQLDEIEDEQHALARTYAEGSRYLESERALLERRAQEIRGEIESLEAGRAVADSVILPSDEGLDPLEAQRIDILLRRRGLEAAITSRDELLASLAEKLEELARLEPVYAVLEERVAEAEDAVRHLARAHNEAELLERIDEDERMSNLILTQEATLPSSKAGPRRARFLLMGVAGGLAAGLALALLRQLLDPRLRYPESVESALGVPVVGWAPEVRSWRRQGRKLHRLGRRVRGKT